MNSELEAKIFETLKEIIDPETGLDIVRMGLIQELKVEADGKVSLIFRPSSPICPLAFQLAYNIKEAIKKINGVNNVKIQVLDFIYAEKLEEILEERE
jgi:metal-sulfur cluster biosynthetic enzyme